VGCRQDLNLVLAGRGRWREEKWTQSGQPASPPGGWVRAGIASHGPGGGGSSLSGRTGGGHVDRPPSLRNTTMVIRDISASAVSLLSTRLGPGVPFASKAIPHFRTGVAPRIRLIEINLCSRGWRPAAQRALRLPFHSGPRDISTVVSSFISISSATSPFSKAAGVEGRPRTGRGCRFRTWLGAAVLIVYLWPGGGWALPCARRRHTGLCIPPGRRACGCLRIDNWNGEWLVTVHCPPLAQTHSHVLLFRRQQAPPSPLAIC